MQKAEGKALVHFQLNYKNDNPQRSPSPKKGFMGLSKR